MTDPHEMFEAFVADAIAKSPEPLKELGKFLSERLDEDAWKMADRLLLQIAAQPQPSQQAGTEPTMFWDADDWENGGCDPADIVENYAPGEVVKLDTAIQGPPRWGVMSPDHEVRIFTTADDAEAWFLAALKPVEG